MAPSTRHTARVCLIRVANTLLLLVVALPLTSAFVVPHSNTRTNQASPNTLPIPVKPQPQQASSTKLAYRPFNFGGVELANVVYDQCSLAFDAWEWTNAIGAPAALIAGAVVVNLVEGREDSAPRRSDSKTVRLLKLSMRFLLLSSFALELIAIFVSNMTGSVLLGHGEQKVASKLIGYGSPLQLLHYHHEFEYLCTQICFIQGLFHWLVATGIDLVLPRKKETASANIMNKCLAMWMNSLILWMLAFYNHHLSFYSDYFSMLTRFFTLFMRAFVFERPIRPLSLLYIPSFLYSVYLTWKAFTSDPEKDDDYDDERAME